MGTIATCTGASHTGNAPAYSSIRYDVIRSMVLMTPRWIITGRFGVSSESLYSSLNCSGRCWSAWMVERVSSRPITSFTCTSIFGP